MVFGWCNAPVLSKCNCVKESHKTQPLLQRVKSPASPSSGWPCIAATVADNSVLDSGDYIGNDHYRSSSLYWLRPMMLQKISITQSLWLKPFAHALSSRPEFLLLRLACHCEFSKSKELPRWTGTTCWSASAKLCYTVNMNSPRFMQTPPTVPSQCFHCIKTKKQNNIDPEVRRSPLRLCLRWSLHIH